MILTSIRVSTLAVLLAGSLAGVAQNPPANITLTPSTQSSDQAAPQEKALEPAPAAPVTPAKQPDKAAAYYHFMMAHMYEEMVSMYGRSDYATKAIDEYRLAIDNDPTSDYLNAGLAELYAKTGSAFAMRFSRRKTF